MSKSCLAGLHFSCPLRAGFCLGFVPTGMSARVLIILARRIGGKSVYSIFLEVEVDLLLIAVVKLSFVTCGAKIVLSHFFNDAFCFAEMFFM